MSDSGKRKKRKIHFNLGLYIFVKMTLVPLLRFKYKVRSQNRKELKGLKPPFIIVANHVTFFDPVFINMFIPRRIHFLTSKTLLRKASARWLLTHAGIIPKTKASSRDMQAVRDIKDLISRKKIVAFFPEGRQTWDGETHPVVNSTAKLLKMLNVPVVIAHVKGGYLSKPRWSKVKRKYNITIDYHRMFSKEDVENLSVEELSRRFDEKFKYSEYDYQFETHQTSLSEKGAEFFEALMYTCPKCGSFISLESEGNKVWCNSCDYKSSWDGMGNFISEDNSVPTKVSDLLDWQRDNFTELLKGNLDEYAEKPLFTDFVRVQRGAPMSLLEPYKMAELQAYSDRFVLVDENGEEEFSFSDIHTMHVTLVNIIEFVRDEFVYRITFDDDRRSAYKYLSIVQIVAPDKAEMV